MEQYKDEKEGLINGEMLIILYSILMLNYQHLTVDQTFFFILVLFHMKHS